MEIEENKDNIIEKTNLPEEQQEVAETAMEEAVSEDPAAETVISGETAPEEVSAEETAAEESAAKEQEPAAAEPAKEETADGAEAAESAPEVVSEETEAIPEPVSEESDDEPPLVTEIVREEKEPDELSSSAEDEDVEELEVEYETVIEEAEEETENATVLEEVKEEPETILEAEGQPVETAPTESEIPKPKEETTKQEVQTLAPEPETPQPDVTSSETEKPQPEEPVKKGSGALAVKIVGIILLLLLIFVPAGYSLLKGEAFQKELINQKKSISRTYESVYRKEIFPKLSQMFVPEWAKQVEKEPEPQGSGQIEPEPQTSDQDKPKDILDGVPQAPEGQEYYPMYIEDHMIIYGRDNWLYTAGDWNISLDYYAGTNVLSEEEMAYCAELLNTLDELCRARGVELVMEVGPNKEQVYPEHFPSFTVENPYKRLLVLEEYLHEHCSAPFLYPIRELAAHKDQYDTYWKYDTHWNSTGAYIGMKAIYEALGRQIKESDAVMNTQETNRGDLAGITGYTDLYTDYITEYKPDVTVDVEVYCDWEYDIDDYGKRYISSAPNERKLFVCGDSFRVSLAAHMCKDYKYTDVVHRDIVSLEIPVARLQELSRGDTLVLICVERWDDRMFAVIPEIIAALQG